MAIGHLVLQLTLKSLVLLLNLIQLQNLQCLLILSSNITFNIPNFDNIFIEGTTDVTALGDLIQAGLPNITGTFGGLRGGDGTALSGAFSSLNEGINQAWDGHVYYIPRKIYFDASDSNSIYGNSNTVQPQSIKVFVLVKY